jgi:hypothetical protein
MGRESGKVSLIYRKYNGNKFHLVTSKTFTHYYYYYYYYYYYTGIGRKLRSSFNFIGKNDHD